jgi:hypothetical protein
MSLNTVQEIKRAIRALTPSNDPVMNHRANADFWNNYHALPADIRARADKQFALLKKDPQHPYPAIQEVRRAQGVGNLVRARQAEISRPGRQVSRGIPVVLDWRAQHL